MQNREEQQRTISSQNGGLPVSQVGIKSTGSEYENESS